MQRRAAAVSAAIFLVLAAGSWAFIGAAQEPAFEVDPVHSAGQGESISVGGQSYTVTSMTSSSATLEWTNESAIQRLTWENGTTIDFRDDQYRVEIPQSNPSSFALVEVLDVETILQNDPEVENDTITRADGNRYVVYRDDGSTQRLSEYLPEPDRAVFEGDTVDYNGTTRTVASLTVDRVVLTWQEPETNEISGSEGGNVTLAGENTYTVRVSGSTLQLVEYADYQEEVEQRDYYGERIAGLWGVAIIAGLTAMLLVGLAFLPSRY